MAGVVAIGGPSKNSAYFSVQVSIDERTILDYAAKAAGMNRNAFIRAWIATLPVPNEMRRHDRPSDKVAVAS